SPATRSPGAGPAAERSERRGLDVEVLGVLAAQHPDRELAVRERGLHPGAVALGQVDLALVAAVLPLLDQVLAGPRAAELGVEAHLARAELDPDVLGLHRPQRRDD